MKEFLIKRLLGVAGQFLYMFIQWLKDADIFTLLLDLAKTFTEEVDGEDISGSEKRAIVFAKIKEELKKLGKSAGSIAINLAIELAVGALKAKSEK